MYRMLRGLGQPTRGAGLQCSGREKSENSDHCCTESTWNNGTVARLMEEGWQRYNERRISIAIPKLLLTGMQRGFASGLDALAYDLGASSVKKDFVRNLGVALRYFDAALPQSRWVFDSKSNRTGGKINPQCALEDWMGDDPDKWHWRRWQESRPKDTLRVNALSDLCGVKLSPHQVGLVRLSEVPQTTDIPPPEKLLGVVYDRYKSWRQVPAGLFRWAKLAKAIINVVPGSGANLDQDALPKDTDFVVVKGGELRPAFWTEAFMAVFAKASPGVAVAEEVDEGTPQFVKPALRPGSKLYPTAPAAAPPVPMSTAAKVAVGAGVAGAAAALWWVLL